LVFTVIALAAGPSTPDQAIPLRRVSDPNATSIETFQSVGGLFELRDGRVVVNDISRHRLIVFDSTLTDYEVLLDSAREASNKAVHYPAAGKPLVLFGTDSALFTDVESRAFVLITAEGKLGRTIAPPKVQDLASMFGGGIDARGNLVYRLFPSTLPPASTKDAQPPARDSVAIVRGSFAKRSVDTIAKLRIAVYPRVVFAAPTGRTTASVTVNPGAQVVDDWAVLSDGTIAIVRGHDYSIDLIGADGRMRHVPKLPFDWRRITDEEKQHSLDSARRVIDSLANTPRPYAWSVRTLEGNKRDTIIPAVQYAKLTDMPDYVPPLRTGSVRADADGNVWIVPTTTLFAAEGRIYDVVDNQGRLVERVALPKDRILAGFGPRGTIYLMRKSDTPREYVIERASVMR
jgi:hypothetical protein